MIPHEEYKKATENKFIQFLSVKINQRINHRTRILYLGSLNEHGY